MTGLFSKKLYFFRKVDAMEKKTAISPPWYTLYNKFEEMFGDDPEITLDIDQKEDGVYIIFESRNSAKLNALDRMLKPSFNYGNVNVFLDFRVANDSAINTYDLAIDAFSGNPMFEDIIPRSFMPGLQPDQVCVILQKKIIQFFDNNLNDFYGNLNFLPTDVAKELFVENDALQFSISNTDTHVD